MTTRSAAARRPVVPGLIGCLALGCLASCASPDHLPAREPASNAPSVALPYNGHGTEPFWNIEIRADSMIFRGLEMDPVTTPTPAVEAIAGGRRYSSAGGFTVTIVDSISDDGMADMQYPHAVTVQVGGQEFHGCGGDPATLLIGAEWTVTAIDSEAVVSGSRATLVFEADGRVGGDASCNRFTGQYTLHGEGMSFSPLASTRKACAPDLMAQEARFIEVLQQARWFEINEGGALVLRTTDERRITAKR